MSPNRCQPTPVPENPGCSMRTCCRPIYGTASAQLQVQASVQCVFVVLSRRLIRGECSAAILRRVGSDAPGRATIR